MRYVYCRRKLQKEVSEHPKTTVEIYPCASPWVSLSRDCQSNESWVMTQSWLLRVLTIWAQITVTGSFVREYCEHRLFVGCLMQIDPRTAVHLWSKNEWEFPESLLRNEWELPQSVLRNEWSKESLWTHPMTQLCLTTGVRVSQVMKKSWLGHDSWPILPFLTITSTWVLQYFEYCTSYKLLARSMNAE